MKPKALMKRKVARMTRMEKMRSNHCVRGSKYMFIFGNKGYRADTLGQKLCHSEGAGGV